MTAMLTLASYLAENARPVHERIAAWVGRRLGEPAELLAAPWEERLRWLDDGRVHVGFLCGWPYSQRVDRPGSAIELLFLTWPRCANECWMKPACCRTRIRA